MSTDTPNPQESTGTVTGPQDDCITGPHDGRDSDGELDHRYWRCERCGLETTDRRLREGCFRCSEADPRPADGEATDERTTDRVSTDEKATDPTAERSSKEAAAGGPPDG